MNMPSYFLSQPPVDREEEVISAFEHLYRTIIEAGTGQEIDYTISAPKWQFLCYLCEQKHIVLHGSSNANIAEFEPRKAEDVNEFGDRRAVYAASDGIWPLYFAIVNRELATSLLNGCIRIVESEGKGDSYYFFSVNEDALPHFPWRNGTVYLLPGDTFEPQPRLTFQGVEIEVTQVGKPCTCEANRKTFCSTGRLSFP